MPSSSTHLAEKCLQRRPLPCTPKLRTGRSPAKSSGVAGARYRRRGVARVGPVQPLRMGQAEAAVPCALPLSSMGFLPEDSSAPVGLVGAGQDDGEEAVPEIRRGEEEQGWARP